MACTPTPTKTEFTTFASTSTLTTSTGSVMTKSPVVTTIHTQSCSEEVLVPGRTSCAEEELTSVSTIDEGQTTVQVPIVIVFEITQASPTRTLFASCLSTASGLSSVTSGSPTSTSSISTSDSIVFITTTVTPAPTFIVSEQTSTLPDGSLVVFTTTFTSTFAPISAVVPSSFSSSSSQQTMINSSSSPASIVGPIIGGALGGFFGLIGIVFLIWWLWNKRRKFLPASLMSEKSPQSSHPGLPTGYVVEPQQYQYGHVGSSFSHGSTPHSVYARSSQSHSNSQSHAHSVAHSGTPPLVAGTASQRASFRQNSSPTPPFFAATAFAPGLSAGPSSANLHSPPAPSTPGHVFQNPPPSSFPARPSRSGYGNGTDDEQSSEGHGSITFLSRRPSRRLSPGVERRVGPQPPESRPPLSFENRSTPPFERTGPLPKSRNSFSERIEIDRPLRPVFRRRSTDATPYEEPGSPLFVVNHTEEPSGSDAEPDKPTSSPG